MKILIKNAKIVAPGQEVNGATLSLFIEDGKIKEMAPTLDVQADKVISYPNLHLSPGWMDPFVHFCDPGFEHKETLETGTAAAAAGGYTTVFTLPNTCPSIDTRSQVTYIRKRSENLPVNIFPIGAISQSTEGKALAEMYDMQEAGAKAFSDGLFPIASSGLMLKALQYVKAFDGIILQVPEDPGLSDYGLVHEGIWSTRLGMSGKPDLAELIMIKRDIDLLRYAESKLHLSGISLSESIHLIKAAKKEGLTISCSITPYHLVLTDSVLQEFDSNYKLTPPVREQKDVDALKEAIKEGIVDCLTSHHIPHEKDSKDREFEYAANGMIGLETAFGLLGKAIPNLKPEEKVNLLSIKPRTCFGLKVPKIEKGQTAELTLFDPDISWEYTLSKSKSKARNSPFDKTELKGKPLGTINKNQLSLND